MIIITKMDAKLITLPKSDVASTETKIANPPFQLYREIKVFVRIHARMGLRIKVTPMQVKPLTMAAVGENMKPFSAMIPPKADTRAAKRTRIPVIMDETMEAVLVDIKILLT